MLSLKTIKLEWRIGSKKSKTFMAFGLFFFILALIGVAIPIVPQVPFAIVSAYFFSKGSRRIHFWMRHNKYFGRPIRDWEDHRIIRPKLKIIGAISLALGAILVHNMLKSPMDLILEVFLGISIIFILTRKSKLLSTA